MTSINQELTVFFLGMYNSSKNSLGFLINADVPKIVLLATYRNFLRENILQPIEGLLIEEKKKLIEQCRNTGIEFNNQTLEDAARIIHTINFINENV